MDRHGLCKHMFSVFYNEQVNTELHVNKYLYVGLFFVFSMAGCILQLRNCFKTGKFVQSKVRWLYLATLQMLQNWKIRTVEGPVAVYLATLQLLQNSSLENSDSRRSIDD